ncbi:MAG: hypothetical protein IKZ61_00655 [Prevotella sp.]|nr:hypothetical protein [Prevotella sp.]
MGKLGLIIIALIMSMTASAQQNDKELNSLVTMVKNLRKAGEAEQKQAFNNTFQSLVADTAWTPMNELRDKNGAECPHSDKSVARFRLNRMLSKAEQVHQGVAVATNGFMNGQDPRFNYSLYEKSVMAGKKVSYSFNGREGRQVFVIVPYKTSAKLSAKLLVNGKESTSSQRLSDGTLIIECAEKINTKTPLTLEISNEGNEGMAMVILNHNTRK